MLTPMLRGEHFHRLKTLFDPGIRQIGVAAGVVVSLKDGAERAHTYYHLPPRAKD
jgi:hypothetical protein